MGTELEKIGQYPTSRAHSCANYFARFSFLKKRLHTENLLVFKPLRRLSFIIHTKYPQLRKNKESSKTYYDPILSTLSQPGGPIVLFSFLSPDILSPEC